MTNCMTASITGIVVSSKNRHLELFSRFFCLMPLMVILALIHYFCLFFRMRKFLSTLLILNCKAYAIILTLPVSWGAFSSATALPIHQLIIDCESKPFILISNYPHEKPRSSVHPEALMTLVVPRL